MSKRFLCIMTLMLVYVIGLATLSYAQTNIAVGKAYTLSPNNGDFWADSGLTKLNDGVSIVTSSNSTSQFVGWGANIPTITVDLGSVVGIGSLELFIVDRGDVAGDSVSPNFVEFSYSVDGVTYTSLGSDNTRSFVSGRSYRYDLLFGSVNARYLKYYVDKSANAGQIVSVAEFAIYDAVVPMPTPTPPPPTPTLPPPTSTPPPPTPTQTTTPGGSSTASFGGVVYGRIVDKYKSPLPEIKVEYSTLGDEYLGKNPVFTDNDGYYYFEDVDTGFGYGLVMSAKRYGTVTVNYPGTVVDSVVRVPDKALIRGNSNKFTLSGTVKDLYLSPVSHARVRVKSSGDPHIVYTDSSGAFSVSDLFVGTYTVTVKHSGYYVGRVKYLNTDGLDGSVDISLQEK